MNKFSFGGNGKMMFGQTVEEMASSTPTNSSGDKPASSTAPLRTEPQPAKTAGGETLGSFSGLRVGPGEEAKDSSIKPAAAAFSFGEAALGTGKGTAQFNFGAILQMAAKDSTGTDLSKGAASGSLFKPPESTAKPAFTVPQSGAVASAVSFSSLLAASSDSSEEPKVAPQPSEPTPPPEKEPAADPAVEPSGPLAVSEPAAAAPPTEPTAATVTAPAPCLVTPAPTPDPSITAAAEVPPPSTAGVAPTLEATPDSSTTMPPLPTSVAATPGVAPVSQVAPAAFQVPSSEKPGSIFTQSAPAATESSSFGITPVINTLAPTAATPSPAVATSTATTAVAAASTVFGQPAAPPVSSAPSAPSAPAAAVSTAFGSPGFGASTGTGFGKPVFGQATGFGQLASNTGTASGFSFAQSAFGASSNSATTAGGLFGASTGSNAISFSFGTSSANTASSTGSGLFGQSTATAFGQSSGFGQGSVFGSNTTTSSSTGLFGQPSGEHESALVYFSLKQCYLLSLSYKTRPVVMIRLGKPLQIQSVI